MVEVAIRNMDESLWREFKAQSARHHMTVSEFFEHIFREHVLSEEKKKVSWKDMIVNHKPILSSKELDAIKDAVVEFRSNAALREW